MGKPGGVMAEAGYLTALNPDQRKAVEHFGGPLLILAGAGSGKTRVITTKIAYLIDKMGMSPRSILAVTFTNKAAEEMRNRVLSIVPHAEEVMIRTFHSFGAWLLRRNAAQAGLDPGFLIYDDEDSSGLLKTILGDEERGSLRRSHAEISRVKDLGIGPEAPDDEIARAGCLPEIFRAYDARLRATGNVDFGDLILLPVKLLKSSPEVKERIQLRFQAVLVDEYQDSNIAQFQLLRELYRPGNYLCVVGDDDQSIYGFRGAEVGNIIAFPDVFPGTEIVRLERNYRSTASILAVASAVVANNTGRLGKTLWTEKATGEPVTLVRLGDQDEEAEFSARAATDGFRGNTAILYRMNAQSRPFEECFFHAGIPYRVVGALRFYSREEVKDAIAYLALLANPRDEMAFRRIVNKPVRGIGKASVERIVEEWRSGGGTLWDACARAASSLSSRGREGVCELTSAIDELRSRLEATPLSELANRMISSTGLSHSYKTRDKADGTSKAANLEELVNAMAPYGSGGEALSRFLENTALTSAMEEPEMEGAGERVTLITLHNTKGLEFDRVIITGLEEGIFPHQSSLLDREELEEERRLFYVGVTRAREKLILTWCGNRRVFGRSSGMEPSRFLDEIPADMVERIGEDPEEMDDGFPPGCSVFHDEYGPGIVERKWYTGGNLLLQVRFRSGRVAKLLPKYNRLERISSDD
jgi:DNA helicase-2/ATP-dependent DNA helicase PcrA